MRGTLMAFDSRNSPLRKIEGNMNPEEIKLVLTIPNNGYIVVMLAGYLIHVTRFQTPPSRQDTYIRTIGEIDVPQVIYDAILASITAQEELQQKKAEILQLMTVKV